MTAKRRLSDVLLESELITEEDVERGLAHQRTHGGYFGEALVTLGVVRREEIEWALASQLDLPFIFPDAESADIEATRLVPPEWALAHLAVPILHAGHAITVVVADPLDLDTLKALRARTGLEVEMALATPARIRDLIRAVYGAAEQPGPVEAEEGSVEELVAEALARGADRIGVSARGKRALGWYTVRGHRERRRLRDGWETELEELLDPSPVPALGDGTAARGTSEAVLRQAGAEVVVDVRVMASLSGTELLLSPRRPAAAVAPTASLPADLRADLRLLAAAGNARVGVAGEAERVSGTLPQLPGLVLGESARWAHVASQADLPGVYTLAVEDGPGFPAVLEAYAFDALTVDLPLDDGRLPAILAAAPLSFSRVPVDADAAALGRAGIRWILTVSGEGPDGPSWELRPTHR